MAIFKRQSSPNYWVGFEYMGRRYRQSSGTPSRRLAEQFETRLRQQVYNEMVLGKKTYEPMRFEDAVKRYVGTHLKTKARLRLAFPSDDEGLVWINAATDGQQLAEQAASVVWQAKGGYPSSRPTLASGALRSCAGPRAGAA